MYLLVIGLNGLLILCVLWFTAKMWQWRAHLSHLAQQLERSEGDLNMTIQEARYGLTHKRVQVAQTQLVLMKQLAIWQQRSRQLTQIRQLIRLLQLVMLSRRPR